MISDKFGKEVRLITLRDLCQHCMCNKHDPFELLDKKVETPRWQSTTCSNRADGCDGFTYCETCPIWSSLQDVFITNI